MARRASVAQKMGEDKVQLSAKQLQEAEETFNAFDENGDGALQKDEIKLLIQTCMPEVRPYEAETMAKCHVSQSWAAIPGHLTFNEFAKVYFELVFQSGKTFDASLRKNALAARDKAREYSPELIATAIDWYKDKVPSVTAANDDVPGFVAQLKTGLSLAEMFNDLYPGSIGKLFQCADATNAFHCMNNLEKYINACLAQGFDESDCFSGTDLYEDKNHRAVIYNIIAIRKRFLQRESEAATASIRAQLEKERLARLAAEKERAAAEAKRQAKIASKEKGDRNCAEAKALMDAGDWNAARDALDEAKQAYINAGDEGTDGLNSLAKLKKDVDDAETAAKAAKDKAAAEAAAAKAQAEAAAAAQAQADKEAAAKDKGDKLWFQAKKAIDDKDPAKARDLIKQATDAFMEAGDKGGPGMASLEQLLPKLKELEDELAREAAEKAEAERKAAERRRLIDEFGACAECGEPACEDPERNLSGDVAEFEDGDKVHIECRPAYAAKKFGVCTYCNEPLVEMPGKYTGQYSNFGTDKVHTECKDAYLAGAAAKCAHCNAVIVQNAEFSGRYVTTAAGISLHEECKDAYVAATKSKCAHCGTPVSKHGDFSGKFIKYSDGRQVHSECKEDYTLAQAEPCKHCGVGVAKAKTFSGEFYGLDEGKVHSECWDDWIKDHPEDA